MLVLVCGSRTWDNADAIRDVFQYLPEDTEIIHGGARGADRLAGDVAAEFGFHVRPPFLPDWESYGKRAGIYRNLEMLDAKPDLVLAFWDGESTGTEHTISAARLRNINVEVVVV